MTDYDRQNVPARYRIGINVFAGKRAVYAYFAVLFDKMFADYTRVVRRSATDDVDGGKRIEVFAVEIDVVKYDFVAVNAWTERVGERFRLVEYLFEHKMRVTRFFGAADVPIYVGGLLFHGFAVRIEKLRVVGRYPCGLAVAEKYEVVCVLDRKSVV